MLSIAVKAKHKQSVGEANKYNYNSSIFYMLSSSYRESPVILYNCGCTSLNYKQTLNLKCGCTPLKYKQTLNLIVYC